MLNIFYLIENVREISLFNGISTFEGYFMLKPSNEKNSCDIILLIAVVCVCVWGGIIKRLISFSEILVWK